MSFFENLKKLTSFRIGWFRLKVGVKSTTFDQDKADEEKKRPSGIAPESEPPVIPPPEIRLPEKHKEAKMVYKGNNPCNVRRSSDTFKGEIKSTGAFKVFIDNAHGYRCTMVILRTYIRRHGIDTIEGIINRFAPPDDNNPTENYINFVADKSGFIRSQTIAFAKDAILPIIYAISWFEQGRKPNMSEIEAGWALL